jgi:hypothetical protein
MGDTVNYYEKEKIRNGNFVCSSLSANLSAKEIFSNLLTSEEDIRGFCKNLNLSKNPSREHIFLLVIEAYLYFAKKDSESVQIITPKPAQKRPSTEPVYSLPTKMFIPTPKPIMPQV